MMNQEKKSITKKEALEKAQHYCAYQERSQQEVRDKLYTLGLYSHEVEEIIADLIENNFLSEERFALAYALGKFRMKSWGKLKIKHGLKQKRVPEKLIAKALTAIDPDEYQQRLTEILLQKASLLKEKDRFKRRLKLISYSLSKGFEKDLILHTLKDRDLT